MSKKPYKLNMNAHPRSKLDQIANAVSKSRGGTATAKAPKASGPKKALSKFPARVTQHYSLDRVKNKKVAP